MKGVKAGAAIPSAEFQSVRVSPTAEMPKSTSSIVRDEDILIASLTVKRLVRKVRLVFCCVHNFDSVEIRNVNSRLDYVGGINHFRLSP